MLGKIIGGIVGEKVAGPNRKLTGTLVGAAVPAIARRGLGPLVLIGAAGDATRLRLYSDLSPS